MQAKYTRQSTDLVLETSKHDPLIKWITWGHATVSKICISTFTQFFLINLVDYWLQGGYSARKHLSYHLLLVLYVVVFVALFIYFPLWKSMCRNQSILKNNWRHYIQHVLDRIWKNTFNLQLPLLLSGECEKTRTCSVEKS